VRNAPVFAPVFTALRRGELLGRGNEGRVRPNLISLLGERGLARRNAFRCHPPRQPALTAPRCLTETAESCHGREKYRARPQQFSADSGQDIRPRPAGGRKVSFQFSSVLRPPSSSHRGAPVRQRADNGGGSENRASVSPLPFRRRHASRFRPVLNALSRAARCLPIR